MDFPNDSPVQKHLKLPVRSGIPRIFSGMAGRLPELETCPSCRGLVSHAVDYGHKSDCKDQKEDWIWLYRNKIINFNKYVDMNKVLFHMRMWKDDPEIIWIMIHFHPKPINLFFTFSNETQTIVLSKLFTLYEIRKHSAMKLKQLVIQQIKLMPGSVFVQDLCEDLKKRSLQLKT